MYFFIFSPIHTFAATFTAGMARRDAPGPFATAPIVQGKWDGTGMGDLVVYNRGTAINNFFYPNIDAYQGSVSFWITPEWNGNDNQGHHIWVENAYGRVRLQKTNGNNLRLNVGSQYAEADVSSWTAGTTYHVVVRWDTKKTIDGTNYISISINDSHTFGSTTAGIADTFNSLTIGANGVSSTNVLDAIIEGFTVYRRLLFDGTYGIDVGNGDEIAKIYDSDENNGNGITPQDPTLLTGSWDVVFALPTNSSTGALSTGTGEAWSHPHSSNVLTDGFAQTTYDSSAWGDEGTSVTPYSVELDTPNIINFGTNASIDDLASSTMTVELWLRKPPDSSSGHIIGKNSSSSNGWYLNQLAPNDRPLFIIQRATTDASVRFAAGTEIDDDKWHHLAVTWDFGSSTGKAFLDGIESAGPTTAGSGAYQSDAAGNLVIGALAWYNSSARWAGSVAWGRLSNNNRYSDNFTPPSRLNPPTTDSNTVAQWNFRDEAGTIVLDETANNNDGTISGGSWNITSDMSTDSPNERVYNWGYTVGNDAVNEGIAQTKSSLAAGQNYVVRAIASVESSSRGRPKIIVRDETNGADITSLEGPSYFGTHSGGNDSSTLTDSTARFPQQLVGWTIYNITDGSSVTISSISGDMITVIGTLAGGTDNDWDTSDEYRIVPPGGPSEYDDSPWIETFTFELPTVARNGVASDSTSISIKLVNDASEGVIKWHQVELLENLLDNPSLETGSGDPWNPYGWVPFGLESGDTSQELTLVHSGNASMNWAVGATSNEGIYKNNTLDNYIMIGGWFYGADNLRIRYGSNCGLQSSSSNSLLLDSPQVAKWVKTVAVGRRNGSGGNHFIYPANGASSTRYSDDMYLFSLNNVSLTVTPTSEANSTESSDEIRVDGRDTYVETDQSFQTSTSGYVSLDYRPRHSASNAVAFAETTGNDAYIVSLTDSDNSDYINVFWDSSNTLKLAADTGSGENTYTWDATGSINANSQHNMVLQYTNGGNITVSVDGTERLSIAMADAFDEAPDDVYFGSDYIGVNQGDATFSEINFDNVSPVITLTAYSPDPGTDSTPTITGSVTDAGGAVSSVEYQMDGTSGSWSACTADDGAFDEVTEAFSCFVSPALTDGEHTIYVRATDNVSNVSTNATDTFTIDTTPPTSFDLDSPGGDAYVNETRPTFRWKATTDETVGLSKYTMHVDNGDIGDFTADDIPVSPSTGTGWTSATEYETDKYKVSYSGFSDGDDNNNYIELEIKSSSTWGDTENDGALKEGKRTWTVGATDAVDNTTSESRTLFVDRTSPSTDIISINTTPFSENLKTLDTSPSISGKVTDSLSGESPSSSSEQVKLDNMVAGGPKEVEVRIEKEGLLGVYSLHSLATVNLSTIYWEHDGSEITDNTKQDSNKYAEYSYTPTEELPQGTYKITITGKDNAGNGGSKSFVLQIGAEYQVITPELEEEIDKIIIEEYQEGTGEEKEKIKEEIIREIVQETEPEEPNIFEKFVPKIVDIAKNIYFGTLDALKVAASTTKTVAGTIFTGASTTANYLGEKSADIAEDIWNVNKEALDKIQIAWSNFSQFSIGLNEKSLALVNNTSQGFVNKASGVGRATGVSIATLYNSAAEKASGVIGDGMIALGNVSSNINKSLSIATNQVESKFSSAGNAITDIGKSVGTRISNSATTASGAVSNSIGNIALKITSATRSVATGVGSVATKVGSSIGGIARSAGESVVGFAENTSNLIAIIGEIYLDKEPTRITDVEIVEIGKDSAVISWNTNHHTGNNKVNYGEDGSYGNYAFSEERSREHTARLSGLKPGTKYVFEVMSQNKNYVYDSFHEFTTLVKNGE